MENFKKQMNKMLYSDIHLLFIAVVVFLGWLCEFEEIVLISAILASTIIFFFAEDITPVFGWFFMVVMGFPSRVSPTDYLYLLPAFIPLAIAIVYRVVKFRHKIELGKLFYPMLAVSVALILGGAFFSTFSVYISTLGYAVALGFLLLFMYVLFNNYIKEDSAIDLSLFTAKNLMYMGIVISLQLFTYTIKNGIDLSGWIDLGWCVDNVAATLLLISAPMCMYLSTKFKHGYIYCAIGLLQYLAIILSFSRGGILFGAIQGVAIVFLTIKNSINRKGTIITFISAAVLVLIGYFIFFSEVNSILQNLLSTSSSSGLSGRDELYAEAWQTFLSSPIFGGGLTYQGSSTGVMGVYYYHSTFFQIIGSMGVVGIIAYGYKYFAIGKMTLTGIKTNTFSQFALASLLGFEAYCMIDTGTFVPWPQMLVVTLLIVVVEKYSAKMRISRI